MIDIFLIHSVDEIIAEFNVNNVMSNKQVRSTFQYLADVADGKIPTMASHLRQYIQKHPLYKGDSILSEVSLK